MAVAGKSSFVAALTKKVSKVVDAAKTTQGGTFLSDQEVLDLLDVPEEGKLILNAKLVRIRTGADKNGNAYFAPDYVVVDGEHKGTPFSSFISLDTKDDKAFTRNIGSVFRILQNLGINTEAWDYEGSELLEAVEAEAKELTAQKPGVKVSLTRYIPDDTSKEHRLNISVMGLTDSSLRTAKDDTDDEEREASKPKARPKAKAKPEVSLADMGAAADEGDDEAIEKLTALAEAAGLDINDFGPWADLAAALEGAEPEEEVEEEETEEEEESSAKPAGTKGKADLGDGTVAITVVSYNEDTNEYIVRDKAKDEYEISADDITW